MVRKPRSEDAGARDLSVSARKRSTAGIPGVDGLDGAGCGYRKVSHRLRRLRRRCRS